MNLVSVKPIFRLGRVSAPRATREGEGVRTALRLVLVGRELFDPLFEGRAIRVEAFDDFLEVMDISAFGLREG